MEPLAVKEFAQFYPPFFPMLHLEPRTYASHVTRPINVNLVVS